MSNIWKIVVESYQQYSGNHAFTVLFFLAVIWMIADRRERDARIHLAWPMLLIGGIIICPVSAYVIMKLIGQDVYFRTGWMIPLAIPVSYCAVRVIYRLPKKALRGAAALLFSAGIIWAGTFGLGNDNFSPRENIFKIPNEAIWISDVIAADAEEQGWTARAVVPDEILCYVRQYDASIHLLYGRNLLMNEVLVQELYDMRNALYNIASSAETLVEGMNRYRCNYVVIPYADEELEGRLTPLGLELVSEVAGYSVFRNPGSLE